MEALPLVPVRTHTGCILKSTGGHVTDAVSSSDRRLQVAFSALYAPAECSLQVESLAMRYSVILHS